MKTHITVLILSLFCSLRVVAQSTAAWVATDGLGRTLPTAQEYPLKHDGKPRTVGIFYITWHTPNLHDGGEYRADVSKVLGADPKARMEWDNKQWTGPSYHWGEPEYGYFLSQDKYVIRHDLSMLADAGVDVLIMDVTNAVCYWDEWEVIFQTMDEMRAEGNRVPKFCFWAFNGNVITVVQSLYERYYKTPRYQDNWFYWEGKPLLLYNQWPSVDANPNGGEKNLTDYSPEVMDFFTLRCMWWGYYEWAGQRYVGTEDHWSFGFDLGDKRVAKLTPEELCSRHQGRMEEMAVTPAQHPISIIGKSWRRDSGEPKLDDHDMPEPTMIPTLGEVRDNPTQYGIYFQDRWNEALQVDPDFIYLNDWNEWTAGRYAQGKDPSGQADMHIDFLGRKENPFYFVDQYNAEFNRTIAPMKGGWTDNYYMQMVQNIRRYKGVAPVPTYYGNHTIQVDGNIDDWPKYGNFTDTRGDVIHRSHDGYGNLHYTDTTGRNDIILSEVLVDKQNIYFAAQTALDLTPCTDSNWMLLLIDTDQDAATGWEGYDYLINYQVVDTQHTTLMRYDSHQQNWQKVAIIPMAYKGNTLEISVPRKLLGMTGKQLQFDFKWADNPTDLNSIITLCTSGDTAPNRRFNYRYQWRESKGKDTSLRIAQLTDIHLSPSSPANEKALQRMIEQINSQEDIDMVLVTGDLTDVGDEESMEQAHRLLKQLRYPYRVVMGNHETKWSASGCTAWKEIFGYERFELNLNGIHLLGFNTGPFMRMAYGHVKAQDLKWLKQRLDSYSATEPVIIVTHYPLLQGEVDNWYEVTDLLRHYNVRLCIGGHWHAPKNLSYDGIPGVLMPACCPDAQQHASCGLYTITVNDITCQYLTEGQPLTHLATYPLQGSIIDCNQRTLIPDAGAEIYPDTTDNNIYNNVTRAWLHRSDASLYSSPVTDGTSVFVGDDAGRVTCYALTDGKFLWSYNTGARIVGTPAVSDGVVVVPSADGRIYGLSADSGKIRWRVKANAPVLGAVTIADGIAYVGASDHCMRAIQISSGKTLWTYNEVKGFIETKPLVTSERVVFGAWDGTLYCLDRQKGTDVWKWRVPKYANMLYSPAAVWPVQADGKVFVADPERALSAISMATGKTVWRTKASVVRETVGLSADGQRIYSKTMRDSLVCYATQGDVPRRLWSCNVGFGYEHAPSMPVEQDGVVYGSTKEGMIFAVEAESGKLLWRHHVGNSLINTLRPLTDRRILFTSSDGTVGMLSWHE